MCQHFVCVILALLVSIRFCRPFVCVSPDVISGLSSAFHKVIMHTWVQCLTMLIVSVSFLLSVDLQQHNQPLWHYLLCKVSLGTFSVPRSSHYALKSSPWTRHFRDPSKCRVNGPCFGRHGCLFLSLGSPIWILYSMLPVLF